MARLARALGTDSLADVDLRQLAKRVRAAGRGRDTVLAHITPAEAKLLKARGGRGSINPKTGLPEFEDDFYDFGGGADYGGGQDASGFYETPEPSFATETVPGGQEFDPSMRAGTETLSASAATPEQQRRADEAVAAIRSPDFFEGTPDLTSDQAQTFNTAVNSINDPAFLAGTPDLNRDQAATLNTALTSINQPNFLGDTNPGLLQRLTSGLGLGNIGGADLARLGLAGAGVGLGVQARNAALQQARAGQGQIQNIADQAQQRAATTQQAMTGTAQDVASRAPAVQAAMTTTAENVASRAAPAQAAIQALATPYQELGKQQVQQALSGALTPMSAQSLQAAQARQAQAQARSGGVGVAQGINQLENLRQALLSNQYQQGLGTQQIGDRYAQSGISTGLAQGNLGSQYSNLATTTGLAQGNLGSQYSNLATTTGLNASGIADQYTLRAIQAGLSGSQEAQRLSQAYFQSLGSILGGTPALRAQQPATTAVG